jgi:uncharacterized protein
MGLPPGWPEERQFLSVLFSWNVPMRAVVLARFEALEDAGAAFDHGDYATALRLYRPLAERGDLNAQVLIGTIYGDGLGAPRDY